MEWFEYSLYLLKYEFGALSRNKEPQKRYALVIQNALAGIDRNSKGEEPFKQQLQMSEMLLFELLCHKNIVNRGIGEI
ncbi:hypothetical protein J6590_070646 [Homalodisca vitripennis]|nr:hypothetical protein J6590_070646 [Homalodisca vitripennis]